MNQTHPRLAELCSILERDFDCDLTDVVLDPELPLGHDGIGLDSLMVMDLIAKIESIYDVTADHALLDRTGGLTVRDLLQLIPPVGSAEVSPHGFSQTRTNDA